MLKFLTTVHYYNDTCSSIIGVVSNIVAMYIVKKRTSKEMRQYSQTLMQNCTVDLLFNIVVFITKEQYEIYDGMFIFMGTGFAAKIGHPWDILILMLYTFFALFCTIAMAIPFYCRYRVFCKNDMLSDYRVIALYFYVSLICISWASLVAICVIPDKETFDKAWVILKNSIYLTDDGEVPIFSVAGISSPLFLVSLLILALIESISYGFILYLGIKLHKMLLIKQNSLPAKIIRFHKEINRVLILQAITPIFAGAFALSIGIIMGILRIKISGLMLFGCMSVSWICVFNPIFATLMISMYRKAVLHPKRYLFSDKPKTPYMTYNVKIMS